MILKPLFNVTVALFFNTNLKAILSVAFTVTLIPLSKVKSCVNVPNTSALPVPLNVKVSPVKPE